MVPNRWVYTHDFYLFGSNGEFRILFGYTNRLLDMHRFAENIHRHSVKVTNRFSILILDGHFSPLIVVYQYCDYQKKLFSLYSHVNNI